MGKRDRVGDFSVGMVVGYSDGTSSGEVRLIIVGFPSRRLARVKTVGDDLAEEFDISMRDIRVL